MTKKPLLCALFLIAAVIALPSVGFSQTIISYSDAERLNYREDTAVWAIATSGTAVTYAAGDASDNNASFEAAFTISLAGSELAIASAGSITLTLSYSITDLDVTEFSLYSFGGGSATIANAEDFHNAGVAGSLISTTPIATLDPAPSTITFDVTSLIKGYAPGSVASFLVTSPISTNNNENSAGDLLAFYNDQTLATQPNGGFYLTVTPVPEPSSAVLIAGIGACAIAFRRRRA